MRFLIQFMFGLFWYALIKWLALDVVSAHWLPLTMYLGGAMGALVVAVISFMIDHYERQSRGSK